MRPRGDLERSTPHELTKRKGLHVPQSSQNLARLSTSPAFSNLASSIDPRIPSDAAAKMLADFRAAVRTEAEAELRAERDSLQARLNRVMDICDREQRNAMRWQDPIPVPEWVAPVQRAALGDDVREGGAR